MRTPADKACVWLRVISSQIVETWKQVETTEVVKEIIKQFRYVVCSHFP